MKPKVSIIIPCYNALPFLKETLDSVYNQTYKSIEIIVIDDGSSDGSFDYLKGIDRPVLLVKRNKGKGACAARNYGFDLATGDFIQYLDADDLLSPNKIELQMAAIESQASYIAVCNTKHFYENTDNGKVPDQDFLYTTDNTQEFLLNLYGADGNNHNMVQTSAWLAPRALIEDAGPWDESLSKDQDGEFFCRVVTKATKLVYTSEPLNFYRKHKTGKNIGNQKKRSHIDSQLRALNSKANQLKACANSMSYKKAFALQYKLLAIDAYPQYIDIYNIAITKAIAYGGSTHSPVLGGRIIELIKKIFGWRVAKGFSFWVHKLF